MKLPALIDTKEWHKRTSVLLSPRSKEFDAIELSLQEFHRSPSPVRRLAVQDALEVWQRSKGPGEAWKKSDRNKDHVITLLDAQLRGGDDSDAVMGAQGFMTPALIHARLGVLYLFGHMNCDDSIFKVVLEGGVEAGKSVLDYSKEMSDDLGQQQALGRGNTALSGIGTVGGLVASKIEKKYTSTELLSGNAQPPVAPAQRTLWEKIKETLYGLVQRAWAAIVEKVKSTYQGVMDDMPGTMVTMLRKLCDKLASAFLKSAAPFISSGLDIAKGVANTIDAGMTKFREWMSGRNVELMAGHPSTVVEAIRRAMWMSVGKGLYETLQGGLKLGMEFASAGASALVSMIVAIVEAVVKTVWKVVEVVRMRRFFREAGEHWQVRNQATALHQRPIAFNHWFRSHTLHLPALSVLTLNSGICGDKMHFLQMFHANNAVITQSEFNKGVGYVDGLKVWGQSYLSDAGFSFSSSDPTVKGLLKLASDASHYTQEVGSVERIWQLGRKFLNA